jgi:acyl carrier protein
MNAPNTGTRVATVVASVFQLGGSAVGPTTGSANLEAWDSLGHLNLMLALEQEFGRSFSIEEMGAMTSVARIVDVLEGR